MQPFQAQLLEPARRAGLLASQKIDRGSDAQSDFGLQPVSVRVYPQLLFWSTQPDDENVRLSLFDEVQDLVVFFFVLLETQRRAMDADDIDPGPPAANVSSRSFADSRCGTEQEDAKRAS